MESENTLEPVELFTQLLATIRNIDGRIDELYITIRLHLEKKQDISIYTDRMKRLKETRFKLFFTMMDLKTKLTNQFGRDFSYTYKDLKGHGQTKDRNDIQGL